jgi:esterase
MVLHGYTEGNGPDLVILHGLFGSGENWRSIARLLADDFRVTTLDLRNHGNSPRAAETSYPAMAADVLHTLDAMDIRRTHIMGHSMGGKTAMQFALTAPDRVDHLVVVDIAPRAYPSYHVRILEGLCALDLSTLRSRKEALERLSDAVPEARVRRFLVKNLEHDESGSYRWRINLPAIRAGYPRIAEGLDLFDLYESPALFIRGDRSPYVRDTDLETVRAFFPEAQFETLPGGHWIHADATERFVQTVRRFLLS